MNTHPAAARKPRVLVTRAAGQASALADELEHLGAEPVVIPAIEIGPPDSFAALDAALHDIASYDWLVFTSNNAVHAMHTRAQQLDVRLDSFRGKVAAIGPSTAAGLEETAWHVDLIPPTAIAESLIEALLPFARKPDGHPTRFLLIRAQEGRELLPETLRTAGAEVTVAPAYRTQVSTQGATALRTLLSNSGNCIDGITFASSSAARNFFALLEVAGLHLYQQTAIASIGPITSEELRELGHPANVEAQRATVKSLAKAMMNYLKGN